MPRRLVTALVLFVLAALAGWLGGDSLLGRGSSGDPLEGKVARVVDGDTLRVRGAGREQVVRVIGIDTPELAHGGRPAACFGPQARDHARRLLGGRRVRLVLGAETTDRFGRTLASVRILDGPAAGQDLALALARAGYARPLAIRPNVANAVAVAAAVREARRTRRGLWASCGYARSFPGRD